MKIISTIVLLMAIGIPTAYAEDRDIRVVFVGDIMLDDLPGKYIKNGHDPFAGFAALFAASDLTIGNLECVVGTTGRPEDKPVVLRANPRVLHLLKKYFSGVSLANNHSGDYGPQAFSQEIDLLDQAGIKYFGGGRELREAHTPFIFAVQGKRIAILGYDIFKPRSFEALDDRPGTA